MDVLFRSVGHRVGYQAGGIGAAFGVGGVDPDGEGESGGQAAYHKDRGLARHVRLKGRKKRSVSL